MAFRPHRTRTLTYTLSNQLKVHLQESDQEEEDRRMREKERRREEKRQDRKRITESGSLDPMDPASYSDIPRGSWSSGLEKDDPVRATSD